MHKITIKIDGLTGSGFAGDSEFGDVDNNNEDDDYNGISSKDSRFKRKEVNSFFDIASNQPASEDNSFESSNNSSKEESNENNDQHYHSKIRIRTVVARSGSVYSSPATAPKAEEQKSYAFSRQARRSSLEEKLLWMK